MAKRNKYENESGNDQAVWFSSHAPHDDQRAALEERGYEVVHIDPLHQVKSSAQAVTMIASRLKRTPALVVAIMPQVLLYHFAKDMSPVPVLYPEMRYRPDNSCYWTGVYTQITGMKITTLVWEGVNHPFQPQNPNRK